MSSNKVNVTPPTSYVVSVAAQGLTMKAALAEWIDNALDAGAKNVSIEFARTREGLRVSCQDDGNGAKDLTAFARIGGHVPVASTKLGAYGVGSKDAALYFGGLRSILDVRSVSDGRVGSISVDWDSMSNSGSWDIDAPVFRRAAEGERGTKITVSPVIRQMLHGEQWQRLLDDLGYMYTPAIKEGTKITLAKPGAQPAALEAWLLPALADAIDAEIDVSGKTARLRVGIVKEGHPNPRPGITYTRGFRVIKQACSSGCGGKPTARIAGWVALRDGWQLTKNKDGISSDDGLYEAVEAAIITLLEKAEKAGLELASAAFASQVESMLNTFVSGGDEMGTKAKRGNGTKEGTQVPTGSGSRHRRATVEQPADDRIRSKIASTGRLRVIWSDFGDPAKLGTYSGRYVTLNSGNPVLGAARESSNSMAIVVSAIMIMTASGGDQLGEFDSEQMERYIAAVGCMMATPITADGKPIEAPESA